MDDRPGDDGPPPTGGWGDGMLTGVPGPSFTSRLDRWVAEARVDQAAQGRARERWLRTIAEEEATFAGVLADLAERASGVALSTTAGRRHRGSIGGLGADFVALRPAAGAEVVIALRAVSMLRTLPAEDPTVGDRAVTTELTLVEILAGLAADRERVVLVTRAGGDSVTGELRSVGQDVAVLRTDAQPPATVYVPLASVAEITLC